MKRQRQTCFLVALTLVASTLGLSFASAQQKVVGAGMSDKEKPSQNFIARRNRQRFRIDPAELPAPKTSAIITNRSLTVPYSGQMPQVPPGFRRQRLRLVSSTQAAYSSCPTATFWSPSKARLSHFLAG